MTLLSTLVLSAVPALPLEDQELLTLYVGNCDSHLTHEKDAGLREALHMIQARIGELPDEVPDFPTLSPEIITLISDLMSGSKTLRIGSSDDPHSGFPVFAQIDITEGDEASAHRLAETLSGIGRLIGIPLGDAREDGLLPVQVPAPVDVAFGSRGSSVLLSVGKTLDEGLDLRHTGLPTEITPSLVFKADISSMLELALKLASEAGEDTTGLVEIIETIGPMKMVFASGSDDSRSYSIFKMVDHDKYTRSLGLSANRMLTRDDVNVVPASAMFASVSSINVQGLFDYFIDQVQAEFAQEGIDDPVGLLAAMTGFHLQDDLISHLGDVSGLYTSDLTGGGGLLSGVLFVELTNPGGMLSTLERLEDIINGLGAAAGQGYVRTRDWSRHGTDYTTLVFPGLPVPIEPTFAVSGNHLFIGLSPSAAVGAVRSANSPGGLTDNPRFAQNLPHPIEETFSISFADTPRLLKDGYGFMTLLCSALTNATRSREDLGRDAGMILPLFPDLARGAQPSVWCTYTSGDDVVSMNYADPSVLVNLTALSGFVLSTPALAVLPAAVFMGVKESQSRRQMSLRSMVNDAPSATIEF